MAARHWWSVVLVAPPPIAIAQQPIDEHAEARHFTLKVLPLLKEKCLGCHGNDADDIKGDYDVRTRDSLIKGGESEEPAIVPGKPDESPFYMAVMWDGMEMPPKENDRLTEEQTEWVKRWIAVGAPWPSDQVQDGNPQGRVVGSGERRRSACFHQWRIG